jgi:hypothetical protein
MMNPLIWFDFVARRRATGRAARKGDEDLALVRLHASEYVVIQRGLRLEPESFAICPNRDTSAGQLCEQVCHSPHTITSSQLLSSRLLWWSWWS